MPVEKADKSAKKPETPAKNEKPQAVGKVEKAVAGKTEKTLEAKEAEKPAEKKPEKKPAGKVERKKKIEKKISSLYEVDYSKNKVTLKNKKCPRCGNIMALHKAPSLRWACGSCGYAEFIKVDKKD
jgi:ubiquitin-small subunit ribosomal protein S27Ae